MCVQLRLKEHNRQAAGEQLVRYALHVIAVQQTQTRDALNLQNMANLPQQLLGLHGIGGLFLHVNALNAHASSSLVLCGQRPLTNIPAHM